MTKKRLFKIACLLCYIISVIVLIVEASMNGKTSAGQSNAVGGVIADGLNNIKGDTSTVIEPEELKIINPISEAKVGDKYQIETELTPTDTTFQSLVYSTSDSNIATISNTGLVTFLNSGEVEITVTNSVFTNITYSSVITVTNVEMEDFSPLIFDKNFNQILPTDDIYTLFLGNNYQIANIVLPENTTIKEFSFSLDNKKYISVSKDLTITPLKYSEDDFTILTITSGNIEKQLKIKTELENLVALDSISYANNEIYATQTLTPKLTFSPNNATFKEYTLTSSDESICKIVSKTSIKGVKEGTATITITSVKYPSIQSTFTLTVLPQPKLTNFSVPTKTDIIQGNSKKISISNVTPKYAQQDLKYKSSDTSIATVDSNGNIKGIKPGTVTITIYNDEITKTMIVNVTKKPDTKISFIHIQKLQESFLFINNTIDLLDYITIDYIKLSDGSTKKDDLNFTFKNPSSGSIQDTIFTPDQTGIVSIDVVHTTSGLTETINFMVLNTFEIKINDVELENLEQLSVDVNSLVRLNLFKNEHQHYKITVSDTSILIVEIHENHYDVKALAEGSALITITPVYDGIPYENRTITLPVTTKHVYTNILDVEVKNILTNEFLPTSNNELKFIAGTKLQLTPIVSDEATILQFTYKSSDENIISITNAGLITNSNAGKATITITEIFSNITKEILINVTNYYAFNPDKPYVISGPKLEYDSDKDTFIIINGYSSTLKVNFTEDSTYKELTFKSLDEDILKIGQDGKITPIKTGKTKIIVICDDNNYEKLEIEINIKVAPKPFIDDFSSFLYKVRKSLGHFGAFLVLGIFSTFTFMLYFSKKGWFISVPINFVQGFAIAGLTEFIQTFVPGRYGCWPDVMIDMSGFLMSAITLTALFLIKELVKFIKQKMSH